MAGIFINFRNQDAQFAPPLVDDALVKEFGPDRVFRDKRSMRAGTDFPPALQAALEEATVLLALIGPNWLTASNEKGRRLDDPEDYVRREICRALKRNIRVIPILLNDTPLPTVAELPDCLKPLAVRQRMRLRQNDSIADLEQIVKALREDIPSAPQHDTPAQSPGWSKTEARVKRGAVGVGEDVYVNRTEGETSGR